MLLEPPPFEASTGVGNNPDAVAAVRRTNGGRYDPELILAVFFLCHLRLCDSSQYDRGITSPCNYAVPPAATLVVCAPSFVPSDRLMLRNV